MNIAILIPNLSGGGAERVAQILGDYYVGQGDKVYYFIDGMNAVQAYPVKGKIVQADLRSYTYLKPGNMGVMLELFLHAIKIKRLKKQYKIDVAISFMERFNYINVLSKGKEKVISCICSTLSIYENFYPHDPFHKKKVIQFFYSRSDITVVLGKVMFNEMRNYYGVPAKKMMIIPNMAVNKYDIEHEEPWIYGSKAVICVGRLDFLKQQERIIRAFSSACIREKDARLIILGKGEQLKYLKATCKKCNVEDRVVFAGFTDNVTYYLKHARVFVMASKVEGFPMSMIEAMNFGVPIITTDSLGECGEIVGKSENFVRDGLIKFCKYGILTPDMPCEKMRLNSPLSEPEIILGEAMIKVLTDNEIYKKYRKQSFKRAEMFRLNKIIKKWDKIIKT